MNTESSRTGGKLIDKKNEHKSQRTHRTQERKNAKEKFASEDGKREKEETLLYTEKTALHSWFNLI